MKITAILLAAFISLLAIEPTMNSIISQIADITIGCCSTDCKPFSDMEANEEQNNDCDKNCNPFQVCNSCVLLVSKVSAFYSLALPNVSLKQNCPPPSLFSSQYISDCWHPPKFV